MEMLVVSQVDPHFVNLSGDHFVRFMVVCSCIIRFLFSSHSTGMSLTSRGGIGSILAGVGGRQMSFVGGGPMSLTGTRTVRSPLFGTVHKNR